MAFRIEYSIKDFWRCCRGQEAGISPPFLLDAVIHENILGFDHIGVFWSHKILSDEKNSRIGVCFFPFLLSTLFLIFHSLLNLSSAFYNSFNDKSLILQHVSATYLSIASLNYFAFPSVRKRYVSVIVCICQIRQNLEKNKHFSCLNRGWTLISCDNPRGFRNSVEKLLMP